jgi:hypothetical protein
MEHDKLWEVIARLTHIIGVRMGADAEIDSVSGSVGGTVEGSGSGDDAVEGSDSGDNAVEENDSGDDAVEGSDSGDDAVEGSHSGDDIGKVGDVVEGSHSGDDIGKVGNAVEGSDSGDDIGKVGDAVEESESGDDSDSGLLGGAPDDAESQASDGLENMDAVHQSNHVNRNHHSGSRQYIRPLFDSYNARPKHRRRSFKP